MCPSLCFGRLTLLKAVLPSRLNIPTHRSCEHSQRVEGSEFLEPCHCGGGGVSILCWVSNRTSPEFPSDCHQMFAGLFCPGLGWPRSRQTSKP